MNLLKVISIKVISNKVISISNSVLMLVGVFFWLQVDYVEPSQNTISLKMIPRIDLDRIKAKMSLVGQYITLY